LAILSIEKIDLDGRGALCDSMYRGREKNEDVEGNKKLFHFGSLELIHLQPPDQTFSLPNLLTY
jgi:hypothetical protein